MTASEGRFDSSKRDRRYRDERVEFIVDGITIGTDASAPYAATWNTTAVPEGVHTLLAHASTAQETTSGAMSLSVGSSGQRSSQGCRFVSSPAPKR